MRRYLDWAFRTWLSATSLESPHNPSKDSIDGRSERYTATEVSLPVVLSSALLLVVSSDCTGQLPGQPKSQPNDETTKKLTKGEKERQVHFLCPLGPSCASKHIARLWHRSLTRNVLMLKNFLFWSWSWRGHTKDFCYTWVLMANQPTKTSDCAKHKSPSRGPFSHFGVKTTLLGYDTGTF